MPKRRISACSPSFEGASPLQRSCSAAKYASIAGAWITSRRAGSSLALPKVWAVPRGTRTNPSGVTESSASPTVTEITPSRTK